MPNTCQVCRHPDVIAINEALVLERTPRRTIANQYGVSDASVQRHKEHIPELLLKASQAMEIANADDLLDKVRAITARTEGILDKAEEGGELGVALAAIRELRGNIELLARLLGKLQEGTTINVINSPQWVEVRTLVVSALDPYPEAKRAVVDALAGTRALEGVRDG